jgi:hypothetical protein
MERNTQKNGILNLLVLVATGVAAFAVAHYGKTAAGLTSVVFMAFGAAIAAVSWFQMRLEERERLEKLEFEELSRTAAGSALFTATETEVFPAQRSREQFERYFVPAFTVLLFVLEVVGSLLLWRELQKAGQQEVAQPWVSMALFGMIFLVLFLLGRYSTSLARLEGLRLLRPGAACLLLSAYLSFVVVVGIIFSSLGFPRVDVLLAKLFVVLLLLMAAETLVNLLLELYRPRVKGKVERPLYESRHVSLLGQPEGILRTAAHTLDYQFGF